MTFKISSEKIEEFIERQHAIDGMVSMHDFELWLEEQPRVGEWTPCSERLPKKVGVYFTSRMDYEGYVVEILPFSPNVERDVEWWTDEVDAWMPLPKPYKVGD